MANLQDSILKAIDTMVSNRVEKLQLDKTITCNIIKCTNALSREYKCSYNGGFITAYAAEGNTYTNGAGVYVLVPESDFSKKKTIIGKAQAAEDDNNISFVSSALSNYNLIGKNILVDSYKHQPIGLHSYLKEEYSLLYQHGKKANEENKFFTIDSDELVNNIKEAEALLIEASFQTRLPKEHRLSQSGVFGLEFTLAFKDQDKVDEEGNAEIKYLSYVLDSNNMTGNPFNMSQWSEQYMIYPIDVENFLYIENIIFYVKDFVDEDNKVLADDSLGWGADVFLKDVELYGLKKITAVNGNYKLSLSMPQGSTFKSITNQQSLQVIAKFTEKEINNLSDNTTFYWFKEDSRVSSTSENYQMYGGAGWARLKDKGSNYDFTTYGNENLAYENKYLCVAVYKEKVILKDYFTIFNEAAKRDLRIESSLGNKFTFDRGVPTLTCLVDNKSEDFEKEKADGRPDNYFKFVWSKIDEYNNVTIFNETKEELQKRYNELIGTDKGDYNTLSALKNKIASLEGVSWNKNKLTYPVQKIDKQAKFKCAVYLRDREPAGQETIESIEYNIGSASIVLQNEGAAKPTDYYIIIENGDQVFQYSESGVAPNNERYTNPLEIKPLTCHLYDPAGLEVNKNTYNLKWVVPLEDSLIIVPKEGMKINPATEKIEWCVSEIYPLEIKENYDYQALNNQIKVIVNYKGQEYMEETTFLFTKVGENGTNGTDLVCKISPISENNILIDETLSLILENNVPKYFNTGQMITEEVLKFDLYQRNEKLAVSPDDVHWSISGGNSSSLSKYMTINNGVINWSNINAITGKFRNQIVRATTTWEDYDYYAFYPVPVINFPQGKELYHLVIDSKKTLKSITYNAEGRNPLYNKNQGVFIKLFNNNLLEKANNNKYIVWSAEGGMPKNITGGYESSPTNAAFKLIYEKNSSSNVALQQLLPREEYDENNNPLGYEYLDHVYILPNDTYDGAYCNNLVHVKIYTNKTVYNNGQGNPEAEIYIPIYMSLNTYGLQSLNKWDGNHIEINEDENYILAPQIGAGKKDKDNTFTGIVMGKAETYDKKEDSIGLLGYSKGKQSIWLDAETGKSIFGLPENQSSQNNKFNEGRIELVPGGTSKIANWNIGSRALYNIVPNENYLEETKDLGKRYSDLSKEYPYSIPHESKGILLSSDPSYISIKSKLFQDASPENSKADALFNSANVVIQPNDSFELQLDPNDESIFTMFRHTNAAENSYFIVSNGYIYKEDEFQDLGARATKLSQAITSGNPNNIIGWRTLVPYSSNKYVIARQLYQTETSPIGYYGSFYFNSVSSSDTYYLPEKMDSTEVDRKKEATIKLYSNFIWHREPKVGIDSQGRFYTNALKDNTTALTIGDLGAFGIKALSRKYIGANFEVGSSTTNTDTLIKFFLEKNSKGDTSSSDTLYITGSNKLSNDYNRPISMHFDSFSLYASSTNSTQKTSNDYLYLSSREAFFGHKNVSYLSLPVSSSNAELYTTRDLDISTNSSKDLTISSGDISISSSHATNMSIGSSFTLDADNSMSFTSGSTATFKNDYFTFNLGMSNAEILSNSNDYNITLNKNSSFSTLKAAGWNITSGSRGIKIESQGASDGVNIKASNSVSVHLTPSGSSGGQVWISPGFNTSWGQISGLIPGSNSDSLGLDVSKGLHVGGKIKCDGNIGCNDIWLHDAHAQAVYTNGLQVGGKWINQSWLDEIQRFYNWWTGTYPHHTHNFSVKGTGYASGSATYNGKVATAYYKSGSAAVSADVYTGSNLSGDFSKVVGAGTISIPYSKPVAVNVSGVSSGPNM